MVAGLYSINTFGAVAGTAAVTFGLMPALGMKLTALILAAANAGCAGAAFMLSRGRTPARRPEKRPPQGAPATSRRLLILFMTGLAGIGFEVLMVRVLSQVLENTVFSFAVMLMVFLFGTALGAGLYHRRRGIMDDSGGLSSMLLATAFFCLISISLLRYAHPLRNIFWRLFGTGMIGAVMAELSLSFLFFLLPAMSMGATFSHLAQSLRGPDGGVGRALCLNTLGGALAPALFGVLLLPWLGLGYALMTIPAAYVLCLPRVRPRDAVIVLLLAGVSIMAVRNFGPHPFASLAEDETMVHYRDGVMASVSVVEDACGGRHLKVNDRYQMGGTTSVFSDRRQAYLPLLLHPSPRRALFLGLGTGATFAGAADFPGLEAEGVELIPEVVAAIGYFEKATGDLGRSPNLRIVTADARRYVTAAERQYDVVVADLFHPARDGAGSLYTMEHFSAIRDLLAEGGLFCQWLPLYQLDLDMFKVITRTFLEVFPEGQAYLAHYSVDQPIIGLVGARQPLRFPENWYRKRVGGKPFRRYMAGFGYDSVYSLLGTFMAGSVQLRELAGDSPLNTDENPVVLFQAPRFVYREPEPPRERLSALLATFFPPDPEAILAEVITEEDYLARSRLPAYWTARDKFLTLGMDIERTRDVVKLYRQAGDPLLDVVRKSVDFSAAYFPLVSIAYDLYPHDREASYRLLLDLERASPLRPEAGILRRRLFVGEVLD